MSEPEVLDAATPESASAGKVSPNRNSFTKIASALSIRRVSALYVLLLFIGVFSVWVPDLFLTATTLRTLLYEQAVTTLIAVGLGVALAAGAFDLSIGGTIGLVSVVVSGLLAKRGFAVVPAIVAAVLVGALVGIANGVLVVRIGIASLIATLGVSSILMGISTGLSGDQEITNLSPAFSNLASDQLFGIALPVYVLLVVCLLVWYVTEQTPLGRRLYATGGNLEAARLSGIRTGRVIFGAFVVCGTIAALAAVLETARDGAGQDSIGPPYLLPAYAAAFLGSTQVRVGRFNVWGTVLATYTLAIGVYGLELAGAPLWLPNLFNGAALLVAVGVSRWQRRPGLRDSRRPGRDG